MGARYLIRFDDICPTLNWKAWDLIEAVLIEAGVKPIVAVIPDNRDEQLRMGEADKGFWDRVRAWQLRGWTIGLHGYQHRYVTTHSGILGLKRYSEFAGLLLAEQEAKLWEASRIFREQGIEPNVWVAPAHSFDWNTVRALQKIGIHTISDGFYLSPHVDSRGMLWIPQQLWRFRPMPVGLRTICINPVDRLFKDSSAYLREATDGFYLSPHVDSRGMLWIPQQLWRFRPMPVGLWTICIHPEDRLFKDSAYLREQVEKYRPAITTVTDVVGEFSNRRRTWFDAVFAGAFRLALLARTRRTDGSHATGAM